MAVLKLINALRKLRAEQVEPLITSGKLKLYDGPIPANCAAALDGSSVLLATISIPADCLTVSASAVTTLVGSWLGNGTGGLTPPTNATFYRIVDSPQTTCDIQGDVTVTGGGGSLTLDNITIAADQPLQITSFTKTENNAY